MSEREDNVYKAKLAEQAERYDGEYIYILSFFNKSITANLPFTRRCPIIDIYDS